MPNVHVPWYPTTICGTHIYLPSYERTDQIVCGSSTIYRSVLQSLHLCGQPNIGLSTIRALFYWYIRCKYIMASISIVQRNFPFPFCATPLFCIIFLLNDCSHQRLKKFVDSIQSNFKIKDGILCWLKIFPLR